MKNLLMFRKHTIRRPMARLAAMVLFGALLSAVPFHAALAQTAPDLGSAANFGVLAGTAVTCTDSTIVGDVGVSPGSVVTQTNCTVIGTVHVNDPAAIAANADFFDAYDALASEACGTVLTGPLTGVTLEPGVYCFDAAATLTGVLTLDALGDANAVWIFKIGTLGTGALTGTNFSVVMANGGQPCNVYWWVAEAATMTASSFKGNVLAGAGTTFTGGSFMGRDFAKAAVTLTGADMVSCSNIVPPTLPPDYCKDYCKYYCKYYCKDHDKDHCKDHDKDHHKDHDKDKNHDKDHDKDHHKDHDKDKNHDKDRRDRR